MHPGGALILTGAEKALGITPEHMRASYDTYMNHGNSSSATIFAVLDRLRSKEMDVYAPGGRSKEYVVGCAFGPGITVEACMLRRNLGVTGLQTPPETESEDSRSDSGEDIGSGAAAGTPSETPVKAPGGAQAPVVDPSRPVAAGESAAVAPQQAPIPEEGGGVTQDDIFISQALEGVELD